MPLDTPSSSSRRSTLLATVAGGLVAALGLSVTTGWHTHNLGLIQVRPAYTPMVYNTALGFLACGIGLVSVTSGRRRLAAVGGSLAAALGLLTLSQYVFGVDLGIDRLLMSSYVNTLAFPTYPGRPAPVTAVCFALCGSALLALRGRSRRLPLVAGILSATVLFLGLTALFGYLTGITSAYRWGQFTHMAVHTAAGFVTLSLGLLACAWRESAVVESQSSWWLPVSVGVGCLTATLVFQQAQVAQERLQTVQNVALLAGHLGKDVTTHVRARILPLIRTARRWEIRGKPLQREWEAEAALNLNDFGGYQAIEWMDPSCILRWVAPLKGNEAVLGKDLSSEEQRRRTLESSRNRREVRMTPPLDLIQGGRGFIACIPIHRGGVFEGFVLGVFRFGDLLGLAAREAPGGYAFSIFDGEEELYGEAPPLGRTVVQEVDLLLYGVVWKLRVWPKPDLAEKEGSRSPVAILIAGSLISALLTSAIAFAQATRSRAREIVANADELSRRATQREALLRINRAVQEMVRPSDLERVGGVCHAQMQGIGLDFHAMVIHRLVDREARTFETYEIQPSGKPDRRTMPRPNVYRMWQSGRTVYRRDLNVDLGGLQPEELEAMNHRYGVRIRCILDVPHAGGTLALMSVHPNAFSDAETQFVEQVAGVLSVGISRLEDLERLETSRKVLQESEERTRLIIETSQDAFVSMDAEGRITDWNAQAETLFGWSRQEATGRPLSSTIIPPQHREAHERGLRRFLDTGEGPVLNRRTEITALHRDGREFPVELTISPLKVGEGYVFNAFVHDITDRRQAEEERDRFFTLSLDLLCIAGFDGYFKRLNPAFERTLGFTDEELLAKPFLDFVHPEDRDRTLAEAEKISTGAPSVSFENRYWCKDGSYKWLLWTATPAVDQRLIYAAARDITERKLSEQALRESEERYRDLFENASDLIQSVAPDGSFLYVNRAWRETLGYGPEEVDRLRVFDTIHPDALGHCKEMFGRVMSGEKAERVEAAFISKTGKRIEVEGGVSAKFVDGMPVATRGIFRDITERKEIDRMKSEFVSTVSHELRTPLTSIRGSLGLIAGGVVGQIPLQAAPLIDIALNNCERLVRLINDILDIEKIESGRMAFDLKPLPLTPLIAQTIEANRGYGEKFQVGFALENPLPDAQVNADADRLTQVLTNLISNAAKFSPPGQTVTISMSRRDGSFRVSVTDRGPGVPESFRRRIFQEFAQADASDARQKGGTGLGLSISKAIVERHGGQIGFDTEEGKGTTFYFDLPEHVVAPPLTAPADTRHRPRILICEDDHDVAALLGMMLSQEGFSVDVSHTTQQAGQLLARHRYDALTLDLTLPGQDGIAFIQDLREREDTRRLPIVVVSAKAVEGRRELNSDAIAIIDWIQKPIDRDRLTLAVRQAMRRVSDRRPRILHVEDDPDVLQLVSTLARDLAEVIPARTFQEARRMLEGERYDLVIIDLALPDGSGLDLLPLLHEKMVPVLVFSATEIDQKETARQIVSALVKSSASNERLLETIRSLIKESA